MIYLSSFMLSNKQVKNPNIYPYNVFRGKNIEPFVFSPITVFYGNNGSGKSTLLNIIANKLQLKGKEYATSNSFGIVDYCNAFSNECSYSLGEDDFGFVIKNLPRNSRYIKSEDILYEIKKIQQKQVLSDGMEYDYVQKGMTIQEAKDFYLRKKEENKKNILNLHRKNIRTEKLQCNTLKNIYNQMRYIFLTNQRFLFHPLIRCF